MQKFPEFGRRIPNYALEDAPHMALIRESRLERQLVQCGPALRHLGASKLHAQAVHVFAHSASVLLAKHSRQVDGMKIQLSCDCIQRGLLPKRAVQEINSSP